MRLSYYVNKRIVIYGDEFMICPYCGKEMNHGVIQSQHEICWKPEKGKVFATSQFARDAIILSEFSFFKGSSAKAYNCNDCKKIIIDYSNGD